MNDLHRIDLVLAVEIEFSERGPDQALPAVLDRSAAEQLGARLAADLGELLPGVQRLGLCMVGALYDQTRVLSAGLPLFDTLADIYRRGLRDGFEARLLTVGARDGDLGSPTLNERGAGGAALLMMPVTLVGPDAEAVSALASETESVFIERGQASPALALALQQAFGVAIPHARFMTLNDLCAMLRLQLEHVGLTELWDLLDGALFTPEKSVWVVTPAGHGFHAADGQVDVLVQSFDVWARAGVGQTLGGSGRGDLGAGYGGYLRVLRQFLLALEAHGLAVRIFALDEAVPDGPTDWQGRRDDLKALGEPIIRELALDGSADGPRRVTIHASDELGTMAFTVEWLNAADEVVRRENLIPLSPQGLGQVQRELRETGSGDVQLAWCQHLCYDTETRRLTGDPSLSDQPPVWH